MKIISFIRKIMGIRWVHKFNQPLVWFLRFLQRIFAPETCWEIDHCNIVRKMGFEDSFNTKSSIDKNGNPIPWFSYPAIEFLKEMNFSDCSVFEYGSGNSTFWWAEQARKVTAVEHDKKWYMQLQEKLSGNATVLFCENDIAYSAALTEMYDVIIIDGLWRDLCAVEALKHIKNDGIIILDDSQRVQSLEEYKKTLEVLRADTRFIQIDFFGFCPMAPCTKVTTLFISRARVMKYKETYVPAYGIGNIQENE